MSTIKLPNGDVVHEDSILGKAYKQAVSELATETFKSHVATQKARILERRARPWWKRWLPFYVTIRFHWNWSK